jgi:hypothetical protein
MAKSASGVRAGAAYIELALRDQVSDGLRKAEKRLQLFGEKVKEIGSAVAMAGAAVSAFGGAIVGMAAASVAAFTSIAGDFSDLAAQTGLSVELMSELETALKDAGTTAADFASSVVKLRKNIFEASTGAKPMVEALDALGLKAEDLINLSADEQFLMIADALSKMKNPTERMALAMQLFGKSAFKMMPLLDAGADGIEAFREQARQMGFSLSGETAAAADTLGTNIEILKDQIGRIAVAIGETLLPVASAFVTLMQQIVGRVVEFVRQNEGLVLGVLAAGVGLLALGTTVGIVGAGIVALGAAITATATVTGALASAASFVAAGFAGIVPAATAAWAAVTGPVVLAIAGIAAVGIGIAYATGLLGQMASSFGALWDTAIGFTDDLREAWGAVADAVAANDFALAGEIAIAGLEAAIRRGLANIVQTAVIPFVAKVGEILSNIPGLGSLGDQAAFLRAGAPLLDFGAREAEAELDALSAKAAKARQEAQRSTRPTEPLDISPAAPAIPALPELIAPAIVDALPDLAPAAAEIQTRMSAMGGFNATSLSGMFGDSSSKIEEHTKRSSETLQKILEQAKKERAALVWS